MNWNPNKFILPELYKALQNDDPTKFEEANDAWENSSHDYQNYLNKTEWPEWLKEFIFGEPYTDMNSSDKLHDAQLDEFWEHNKKLIIVLSTRGCAWDARKAVVVIEYNLASPVEINKTKEVNKSEFQYDQFSDLGGNIYRHYIMFTNMNVQIDFNYLKVTRFDL